MIRTPVAGLALLLAPALAAPAQAAETEHRRALEELIARHAQANGVPAALVHRVVARESRYNARAVGRGGAMGLMQIKHATARRVGYGGSPAGLLDADTNLTYGVRYLAGAYRVADGDAGRAVAYFTRGYYDVAKRRGMLAVYAAAPTVGAAVPDVQQTGSTDEPPATRTASTEPEAPAPAERDHN
jgi:soluble lytic murein transglycosylase-like protein